MVRSYSPSSIAYSDFVWTFVSFCLPFCDGVVGMARIMTCSRGLARALLNPDAPFTFEVTGVPECFEPTKARLAMSDVSVEEMYKQIRRGERKLMH